MSLTVDLVPHVDQLSDNDLETWNGLATTPFQRWEWLGSWCSAYQSQYQLHILSVKRDGEPIAFVPWCIEKRIGLGRTLQFLGSGKACSDHLSLLVREEDMHEVCDTIASWLADENQCLESDLPKHLVWDAIELIGVDKTDDRINCLVDSMRLKGLEVEQTDGSGCYVIDVPDAWEDYIKLRSKSGRREIRQSQRNIDDGTIAVRTIESEDDLDQTWEQFKTLHQSRREAAGTTGCFDHPPFGDFLRKAASELLKSDMLRLIVASADGVPIATQFSLVDDSCWYFYQSGMAPEMSHLRPGLSVFCHTIRETIQSGRSRFDMLRGDEPYKLRWRAELQPAQEVRVCSPRTVSKVRNQAYSAGVTFKNMVKSGLGLGQLHQ